MTKKPLGKLGLRRETIRILHDHQLASAGGGVVTIAVTIVYTITETMSCNEPSGGPFCWTGK
jgi:hypothetical protein